jgi:hypothetical protein
MTTPAQTEANRKNAALSTGPRTATGKAKAATNAVRHGLRSELAVLPFEQADDWVRHQEAVVRSLAPAGGLEQELATRAALCLWRLRRVAAYEAATTTAAIQQVADDADRHAESIAEDLDADPFERRGGDDVSKLAKSEKKLGEARDQLAWAEGELAIVELLAAEADGATPVDGGDAGNLLEEIANDLPEDKVEDSPDATAAPFLVRLGVPKDEADRPWDWAGWTVGMVRKAVEMIAAHGKFPADKLLARMVVTHREDTKEKAAKVRELAQTAQTIRRRVKAAEDRQRLHRLLPDTPTLDKLTRYEAHVSRQLYQALDELERLQAVRAAAAAFAPPAPVDVTVAAPTQAPENEVEGRQRF